jgi:hypothetical protein
MNKHIKYIIILLLGIIFSGQAILAQTPQLNEEKYWDYRDRLRNEFMIGIGPDIGMSIPGNIRDTVHGILQFTDCTMAHGEYIAVLATEYKILTNNAAPTEQTVKELFYALYALNRLDYTAEVYFGGTASLNGFFMRDDIAEDSLNMEAVLEHLNQGLSTQKISGLDSDYMDEIPRNNEESLDQAILLITGLALVTKCIPEDVVYMKNNEIQEFQDFETSLSLEAGHIINRIVNYMKEGDSVTVQLNPSDPNLYGIQGLEWDFVIKNPTTMMEVLRGPNAFFLSKGYTSAKYHSTGLLSPTTDLSADTVTTAIFIGFEDYIVPNDQDFKVINLNAMANFWPDGLQMDTANTDYNARVLGPRSQSQFYEWIPMIHQLIFGGAHNYLRSEVPSDTAFFNNPKGYYEYLINLAPPEGPYNYNDSVYPNWEWSTTSRTIQPARRGDISTPFTGNYDGLDYMLYYNMFTLLFSEQVDIKEMEVQDVVIYPNPFIENINIKTSHGLTMTHYDIITLDGRTIMSEDINNSDYSIRASHLPAGVYFIRITDIYQHRITRKLIKQHF